MCTVKPESSVGRLNIPPLHSTTEHLEIPSGHGRKELAHNLKFLDKNEKKLEDSPQLHQNVIHTRIIQSKESAALCKMILYLFLHYNQKGLEAIQKLRPKFHCETQRKELSESRVYKFCLFLRKKKIPFTRSSGFTD